MCGDTTVTAYMPAQYVHARSGMCLYVTLGHTRANNAKKKLIEVVLFVCYKMRAFK